MHRRTFLTGLGAAGALGLLGCGANRTSPAAEEYVPDRGALQVYSAQHQNLTAAWVDAFSAETGVRVQVRKGQDASMGHQIVAEGDASPADVFITENSPAMTLVERAGLLAEVGGSTRQQLAPASDPVVPDLGPDRGALDRPRLQHRRALPSRTSPDL